MKKIYFLILILGFLTINVDSYAQTSVIRSGAKRTVYKTGRVLGASSFKSSQKVIRSHFKDDVAEAIIKSHDDKVLKRLAGVLTDNPQLKNYLTRNPSAVKVWAMMGKTTAASNPNIVKYFSGIMNELGETAFKSKYVFSESGNSLLVKSNNGRLMARIENNIIHSQPWKGGKDLNPLLSEYKLIPNSTYRVNGQNYVINNKGLYEEISGTLTHIPAQVPARNTQKQGLSKKIKDGVPETMNGEIVRVKAGYPSYKDEGGHIIANRFGGGSEMYNYVPMSKKLNKGQWKTMEDLWAKALSEGKKVDYKIKPVYNGKTQRPDLFNVTYEIDGKRFTEIFDNNVF